MTTLDIPAKPVAAGGGALGGVVRVGLACAALAIGLGATFVALLALALACSSDARISAHLRDAADHDYFARASYPMSPFGVVTEHQYDMYTDCVAFGLNLGNADQGLLRRIAASPTAAYEAHNIGPCGNLVDRVHAGDARADQGYLRFWHGYQVWFRPLLSVMTLDAFRRLTALVFFAVLLFFAWRVDEVFGRWSWAAALLPFFALSDFLNVAMVSTHALSLTWAFLTAALTPIVMRRVPNAEALGLPLFAFAAGATSNFLNFLLNPPLAPALMAFFYIGAKLSRDPKHTWNAALYAGGLAVLWFAGFAAAWIEKWLFAALVLGPDAVMNELQHTVAKYDATRTRMGVHFLGASRRNLMNSVPLFGYTIASLAASGALLGWLVRKHGDWRRRALNFLALTAPLAIVVLWVELNQAHSSEHAGFVSRSFVLFAFMPLLAAVKLWRDARAES